MADQVIIEFIGDTSKLEEAYGKLNEQVSTSSNLNKENTVAITSPCVYS